MLIAYRILINLTFILSPIILIFRLLKKKEDPKRFVEKIGFFKKLKIKGNLIWFHGASVGELQSIIPLLEKFEKNKKIKQILITSNTLSSSKVIKKLKLKKIVHQFFPIDTNYIINKFINYWQPSKVFFIDSEIWPNTVLRLKQKEIPVILINGRITNKSYKRWKFFSNFAKKIFSNLDLCLASSKESFKYLKNLGVGNIKFIGNLKFSQSQKEKVNIDKKLKKILQNKKIWCASSTHQNEEIVCGLAHIQLKKKIKNLLTIIIPRHINRCTQIKKDLEKLNLVVHTIGSHSNLTKNTDIFLINSYGKTKIFFNNSEHAFLGGSLIKHGGQNPLEPARLGCNILHGPYVHNFKEIYKFLENNRISQKIQNQNHLVKSLEKLFNKRTETNKTQKKLKLIGKNILEKSYNHINLN
jgi:3-deoxy-D-manno-octulosonic-acid transferase